MTSYQHKTPGYSKLDGNQQKKESVCKPNYKILLILK